MNDNNWQCGEWEFTDVSLATVVDDHWSSTWEPELVLSITDSDGEKETVHLSVLNNVMVAVEREVLKHLNSPEILNAREEGDWEEIADSLNKVVSLVMNHEASHALMKIINEGN